jgi:hypothetical protein
MAGSVTGFFSRYPSMALELETKNVDRWEGTERRRILLKLLDGS